MSRWSDDDYETRREREREYRGDVFYEAWRSGIDPDRAVDCASDCYSEGKSAQECVAGTAYEIRRERERRQEAQEYEAEQERQYYEQLHEAEMQAAHEQPEPEPEPSSGRDGQ